MLIFGYMDGWVNNIKPRALTTLEQQGHELLNKTLITPLYEQNATIRFNSTYIELVDKHYYARGSLISLLYLVLFACLLVCLFIGVYMPITIPNFFKDGWISSILFITFGVASFGGIAYILYRMVRRKDFFSYTHFPIILNRKSRQVYVYQSDSSVKQYHWDELYFTIAPFMAPLMDQKKHERHKISSTASIFAYLLDEKGEIKEGFIFPYYTQFEFGVETLSGVFKRKEPIIGHWEYIRRYMEGDYVDSYSALAELVPIKNKRESLMYGFKRMYAALAMYPYNLEYIQRSDRTGEKHNDFIFNQKANFYFKLLGLFYYLMWPFSMFLHMGRAIYPYTCKVARWPAWVEAENTVEADDPYNMEKHPKAKTKQQLLAKQDNYIVYVVFALAFVLGTAFWVWLFFGIGALKGEF